MVPSTTPWINPRGGLSAKRRTEVQKEFRLLPAALVRSVAFNRTLPAMMAEVKHQPNVELSTDGLADHISALIAAFVYREGRILDERGSALLEAETCPEDSYSEDIGRYIGEYLGYAERPRSRRLHKKLVRRVQFFALGVQLDAMKRGLPIPDFYDL